MTEHFTLSDLTTKALTRRLWADYVRPHLGRIMLAVICMILSAAAVAGNAYIMQPVFDEIFLEENRSMLLTIPLIVVGIALVKGISTYAHTVIMKIIGQRIVTTMQLRLYEHLLCSDITLFGNQSSGRLVSRFSNDIHVIRKNLTNVLTGLAKESVTLLFLVALMFYRSVELTLIAMLIFPIAIYPIIRLGRRMRKLSEHTQEELGTYTSTLDDTFQGIRIVKAYGNENYEANRAEKVMDGILSLYIRAARVDSAAPPLMEILSGLIVAAVIWYGGMQVIEGTTTPGTFVSFITAFIMAYKPMKSLSGINTNMQEGLAAVARVYSVLDTEPSIRDAPGTPALVSGDTGIHFRNVSFAYDVDKPALKNISLEISAGKRVALVGPSGAGKSTIMNMILRFYDPDEGTITIGDTDIRSVTLASLRQKIAIVNQEATLFDDTIRANILYGRQDATEDEMIDAAANAAAHDFIMAQPNGYDTLIGQHGMKLSGGQRQRLAIARAMLRDAPILLLDEATSSLDTVSEQQVQAALDRLMQHRTTLVIAHRLSTVMDADLIYVVKDGEIVESGTHQTLLEKSGLYNSLYTRQFSEE